MIDEKIIMSILFGLCFHIDRKCAKTGDAFYCTTQWSTFLELPVGQFGEPKIAI